MYAIIDAALCRGNHYHGHGADRTGATIMGRSRVDRKALARERFDVGATKRERAIHATIAAFSLVAPVRSAWISRVCARGLFALDAASTGPPSPHVCPSERAQSHVVYDGLTLLDEALDEAPRFGACTGDGDSESGRRALARRPRELHPTAHFSAQITWK